MKLIISSESGLTLLRPSGFRRKLAVTPYGLAWDDLREQPRSCGLGSREVLIAPGAHEVERGNNPFIPGGEPWLFLKGSRIGAAEAYLRRLATVLADGNPAVGVTSSPGVPPSLSQPRLAEAA
jgi:hypothetical protein